MSTEQLSEPVPRKHGFVITREGGVTALKIFTMKDTFAFELTNDQLLYLQQQVSDVMFNHFRLVPR